MDNKHQHLKVTTELCYRASPSFYTSFIDTQHTAGTTPELDTYAHCTCYSKMSLAELSSLNLSC